MFCEGAWTEAFEHLLAKPCTCWAKRLSVWMSFCWQMHLVWKTNIFSQSVHVQRHLPTRWSAESRNQQSAKARDGGPNVLRLPGLFFLVPLPAIGGPSTTVSHTARTHEHQVTTCTRLLQKIQRIWSVYARFADLLQIRWTIVTYESLRTYFAVMLDADS